ncbi:MAG: hypothetical protein QM786_10570 [Breznakibacter sp.]
MLPKRLNLAISIIFTILLFSSCIPKSWPENALTELQNSGVLSEETRMMYMLSKTSEKKYLECVLATYKQQFPDYSDFEKMAIDNPQKLKELRIPCIKKFAGNNLNLVWNFIEATESIRNLKNKLPDNHYKRYKSLMMSKINNEFQTMSNFIDRFTNDEASVITFIYESDRECGDIINNEIKREEENRALTLLSNNELNNFKTSTESEDPNAMTIRAYRIGRLDGNGADIIVKLQNFGEKTLVKVKFTDSTSAGALILASKNPNYQNSDADQKNGFNRQSNYNYIFTDSNGVKWGFLLEI